MKQVLYGRAYDQSHALLVGINDYSNEPPLEYAVNDAVAVKSTFLRLGFEDQHVTVLQDVHATRAGILEHLYRFTRSTGAEDRVVFFFAGHGHTVEGPAQDVGFLIPVEGDSSRLDTLLRWQELTSVADLIPAKHVLFIMDACYGGLAVQRSAQGQNRFLRDLYSRRARQVIAAGKGDQKVLDAGGPRKGNSIFTGNLLVALEGDAATTEGVITANGVMNYVYTKVGTATHSQQTPHYGTLEGDGDLVFKAPPPDDTKEPLGHDSHLLVSSPKSAVAIDEARTPREVASEVKKLLANRIGRIHLNDLVMLEVRRVLATTQVDPNRVFNQPDPEALRQEIADYESKCERTNVVAALLGRWCDESNVRILTSAVRRRGMVRSCVLDPETKAAYPFGC